MLPFPSFLRQVLQRVLWAIPTLLVVSLLSFAMMRFQLTLGPWELQLPGLSKPWKVLDRLELRQPIDPLAELRQNPQISKEALAKEEKRLALNKPWYRQAAQWLWGALHLDFGTTLKGEQVAWLIGQRASNTLLLNSVVISLSWLLAIPLGVLAAVKANSWVDRTLTAMASVTLAIPGFLLALGLALLAAKTGWFPLGGLSSPLASQWPWYQQAWDVALHLTLPAAALCVGSVASLQRTMRANLLECLQSDYVRLAHARGLTPFTIIVKHALRNALNPMATLLGFEFASLLSGALLVETVLGYPGLGYLTYQAVLQGDTNLVMSTLVLATTMLLLGNLLADLLLQWLDPRVAASSS
jgi:peptide/nickel transport system permease protein